MCILASELEHGDPAGTYFSFALLLLCQRFGALRPTTIDIEKFVAKNAAV